MLKFVLIYSMLCLKTKTSHILTRTSTTSALAPKAKGLFLGFFWGSFGGYWETLERLLKDSLGILRILLRAIEHNVDILTY